jgi:hypothetical protein
VITIERSQALFFLAAALILTALAVPRFNASLWELWPDAFLDSLPAGTVGNIKQLQAIKLELEAAINISATARALENLGVVNTKLAEASESETAFRHKVLLQAEQALQASLTYSCANPYAWFELAQVRMGLGRKDEDIVRAVAMSMLTGRAESSLYLQRLNLALKYYQAADDETRSLIAQQLRLSWKLKRNEVLKLVLHYHREDVISAALSYSPVN